MDREGNPDIGYHSEPLWMPPLHLLSTHAIILICVLLANMVTLYRIGKDKGDGTIWLRRRFLCIPQEPLKMCLVLPCAW